MLNRTITRDVIANPKTKYGDARASTRHFITQRVTGALNVLFICFLVYVVVRIAGHDRAEMIATIGKPWIGLPLAVLLVNVTIHMRNGMRDTLEDYFAGRVYSLLMMLNTLFTIIIALVGVASILKLVFWG